MIKIEKGAGMIDKDGKEFDGYISSVQLPNGKVYKLRCEITEIHPMTCQKCGGPVTLKYGYGKCDFCGTCYSTQFKIVEE